MKQANEVKCSFCLEALKPGYYQSQDYGLKGKAVIKRNRYVSICMDCVAKAKKIINIKVG